QPGSTTPTCAPSSACRAACACPSSSASVAPRAVRTIANRIGPKPKGASPSRTTNSVWISSRRSASGAMVSREVCRRSTPCFARDLPSSEPSVTILLDRYDHLLALSVLDVARLRRLTKAHKRLILALDGLQPDAGHEVLWLLRECLSGQILLCRSLLSATQTDLAWLLEELRDALDLPSAAVVWDGQRSIRNAVARAFASVAHQPPHFPSLPEAAMPLFQADRHAKKELKKRERGIRPLERALEQRDAREATLVRG